ncbi:MAG: hypothetical protein HYR56_17105 [Acidobacteria bacterium]|nr:hypothetical protein [Acidobacteriota bacterium]MBI3421605.1 hypothetical protein [Acidobacteriota bacterium]
MSTPNDKHGKDLLPEDSGVVIKPIAWFLIILTLATAMVYVIIKGMTVVFNRVDQATYPAAPPLPGGGQRTQREPLLQGAPKEPGSKDASLLPLDEMREYRKKTEADLTSYGFVAGKENVEAHIPVERAKQLLLERGLPVKAEAAVSELATAEKTRAQLSSSDASAGRLIGKQ